MTGIVGPLTCLEDPFEDDDDPVRRRARELWITDCADCHGLTGDGAGAAAERLPTRPPDFRDPCRKLSDAWVRRVIVSGGAEYRGSAEMKPHHELRHEPEVLEALVRHVQSLRVAGPCPTEDTPSPRPADDELP